MEDDFAAKMTALSFAADGKDELVDQVISQMQVSDFDIEVDEMLSDLEDEEDNSLKI